MACLFSTICPPTPPPLNPATVRLPIKPCLQTSSHTQDQDFNTFPEKIVTNPTKIKPPGPGHEEIILVRHGQSQGNVDEHICEHGANRKVRLTEQGITESVPAGVNILRMIEEDGTDGWIVYFYVSPYQRAIERLRNLAEAFDKSRIAGVRKFPGPRTDSWKRLLEIFTGGSFTGFRETLRHDIDIGRFQPPVEQFEGLYNLGNNKMIVMERGYGGRYSLLMHRTKEELKELGLTDEMLADQEWQKHAKPGEVNYDCRITGASYFTHFKDEENKTSLMINLKSELAGIPG